MIYEGNALVADIISLILIMFIIACMIYAGGNNRRKW